MISQALESKDLSLCAQLYSYQADALIGLAGEEDANTPGGLRLRLAKVNKAEFFIDRARGCKSSLLYAVRSSLPMILDQTNALGTGYKRMEDINGECEMLAKKALIAKFRGDEKLAQDWEENYKKTYDEAMAVCLGDGAPPTRDWHGMFRTDGCFGQFLSACAADPTGDRGVLRLALHQA